MPRHTAPHTFSSPRLPLLCIFLTLLTQALSSPTTLPPASTNQLYVVCKNLDSNTCVTWLFNVENDKELSNELTPFNRPSEVCGLSDLEPIPPHRKFISVTPFESSKHYTVFCKTVKVVTEDAFHLTDFTGPFTSLYRERRQAAYGLRGRYRGQTQSQYLAIDGGNGKDEGKAEAHSAADSSRASVSGNSGMGQAQSQTIYDPSCEECYGGRGDMDASNLRRPQHNIYDYGRGSPDQRGQGIPGQGGIGGPGQGIPGQGGVNGQGRPGQGNGGQGIPGQGGTNGQGRPGQGIGGQGIPGQGGLSGQGRPGHGDIGGQGMPGQGGIGGQGIPGQGGINGQGRPGQGIGGQGIPGQGGINGQGMPGQGGIGGQGIPGQGGINGQGRPGQGSIGGQGIPGQGGINGQGRPGQGSIGGQGIPGQGGINGQGRPGQGGIGGQGIPGQGGINGQGMPGQGGIGGQGIPGQGGINGHGRPGQGGIGGQGVPGQGGINGQGMPGQGGTGGQGIPGQGGINGQGIPGQGGIGGQGIPGQGGINGQGIPGQGGIGSQGIPGQGGKWPIASGPIRGPDGLLYYCCVVNPNQVSYPNQLVGSNTGGVQQTPGGNYGYSNGAPQITGANEQRTQYGNEGNGYPGYTFVPGGTGKASPGEIYSHTINPTGQQPNYGIAQPGPSYNYGAGSNPNQYGQTDGTPSNGNNLQLQPNEYSSSGNGQQGHPYTYGPGVDRQNSQNRPYEQESPSSTGQQGPNYTYGPGGNVQTGPGVIYGDSQAPTGTAKDTGQGGQYVPDYTYSSRGPGQPSTPGTYGQVGGLENSYGSGGQQKTPTAGGQQTVYSQGGNDQQQIPSYNYGSGGSGQPNLSGTYGQTGGDGQSYGGTGLQPQYGDGGNGQLSPTYTYGGNGQPNVGESYGQGSGPDTSGGLGHQNTYGQDEYGQQRPGYTYDRGGTGQPTHDGSSGVGPQPTYDHGGPNAQKGSDSSYEPGGGAPTGSYGQSGGPQTTMNMGSPNSYPNGQQGNNQGQQNLNGYEQSQGSRQSTNNGEQPQNVMDPNSIIEEDDESQALASVYQGLNGTTASASSQGGNDKGRAQTNVQGTYTDSGSFSAQASISDDSKGAESQVSGSKKGATSNAAGKGRKNKSQAAVKLGSETGSIQTESQSGGNMHSSNTQVQGSVKGGVADAQARGPGSTSSQAQIGFTPYKEGDKAHEIMKTPFEGGGTASAQSSGRMGTSQSQLRGTFKYGITYNGAAQAGASLDKDAVFSNFTPFDKIDVFDQNNTNINVNIENTDKPLSADLPPDSSTSYEGLERNENSIQDSDISYNGHSHYDHHKPKEEANTTNILPLPSNRRAFSSTFDSNNNNNGGDYDYNVDDTPTDEYDVEEVPEGVDNIPNEYTNYDNYGRETENTHQLQRHLSTSRKGLEVRQTTGGNTQHILIGSLKNQDAKITQIKSERPDESKVYQPGERVPGMGGYTIPAGFTGSVKSVSSKEKTYVVGSKHSPSQAQTVTLTPGSGKVKYTYPEHYGRNSINPKDLRSLYNPRADDNRYVSVSKSVTRDLDSENNIRKQYSHTYYTKSSSCGYFTFTCTMVSSAEGKKKVCRPKIPTNPDGTPMRC